MINSREIAMQILYDIQYNGAYSNMALKNAFNKNKDLTQLDKAFITNLVYGIISNKLTIEHYIRQNSKIKLKKISKYILIALQLGIYQLKYMSKVPQSAAVNESVKLAKKYGHGASASFVNAVLRATAKKELVLPEDKFENMSCRYSYPVELCKKFVDDFGFDFAEDLLKSMNDEPKINLRVNTLKTSRDELIKRNKRFLPSTYYCDALIAEGFDVGASDEYKKGLIYPQDISAMMASVVLCPKPGERVLDLCAAPGGKTTHIAQLMNNDGEIIACDIHPHKVDIIEKNAQRLGIDIINTVAIDSTSYIENFNSGFDKVIADVPCSGLGIIRRKPDIKWNDFDYSQICDVSYRILTNAMKYVKIGGELVFSTCTLNKDENEKMLFKILEDNNNFETVDISQFLPEELVSQTAKDGYVTFYPNISGIDGFFISKIKRCR